MKKTDQAWLPSGAEKDKQSITADWQFTRKPKIQSVRLREVRNVPARDGFVTEVFRRDWGLDEGTVDQVFQRTLLPGGISAWHAHASTTDRLFVADGYMRIVLYDAREDSPSSGQCDEFFLGTIRPGLLIVPPRVWHGVQNLSDKSSLILNLVDRAYEYEDPDHWRLPPDSPEIPYRFGS